MFTGIIEEIGVVTAVSSAQRSTRISIKADKIMDDIKLGDSVAVDGVCLTVCDIKRGFFVADVSAETLSRTGFAGLRAGRRVNLERAMRADGRFGGHMVSGHIDGTGVISRLTPDGNAMRIAVSTSDKVAGLIIEKGSIAIDGISLTVTKTAGRAFEVCIIPHTETATTLMNKKVGDIVNLENDMVGKYIAHFCGLGNKDERITMQSLKQAGF